jgi:hypothetical protein
MTAVRDDLIRELERNVDRLGSMHLTRAQGCEGLVYSAAAAIVDLTGEHPSSNLPHLQAHALGSMLAVVGRDYLGTPENDERDQKVVDLLIALRRALP